MIVFIYGISFFKKSEKLYIVKIKFYIPRVKNLKRS